ncbi:ABC transporter, ATP-binding protein [Pseudoalteromonas luteoviolacea B = ATCC 29581]|nr:ABC transporter, ATP-binding protein [Pseudoalteromonas luteoviolacea B = ATCC 29581]
MIIIRNLTKSFGRATVFSNFNLTLSEAKVCLQAPNGRGKSTLFAIISGLDPHYAGEVKLNELANNRHNFIALASDSLTFPDFLSAKQVLQLTQAKWLCDWPFELIDVFGFELFLETNVAALSSGNHKKLQLINAMMRKTDTLILDEPSAALDAGSVAALLSWIDSYQGQLIISSHEPDLFLEKGFILQSLDSKND